MRASLLARRRRGKPGFPWGENRSLSSGFATAATVRLPAKDVDPFQHETAAMKARRRFDMLKLSGTVGGHENTYRDTNSSHGGTFVGHIAGRRPPTATRSP